MTASARTLRVLLLTALAEGCQTHAAACDSDASITQARDAWQARQLHNYQFVWQQQCYCLADARQPIRVTVRNGEIVSATGLGGAAVADDVRANVKTIDALYAFVEPVQCDAADVRVEGVSAGVPAHVYVDPKRGVADDEFDVTISEFVAIDRGR